LAAASACALPELRGEELRVALAALGRVAGSVDVEMVLDLVFSQFCIGK
jgi:tRNA modification GTPase